MDDLGMIRNALAYEESFLPEIHELVEKQLRELRLSSEKEGEARELLDILTNESKAHFSMLKKAYLERGGDPDD